MSDERYIVRKGAENWPEQPLVPVLRTQVTIRTATMKEFPFIDQVQKLFGNQLGFMFKSAVEKKIALEQVRLAADAQNVPMGYCMAQDTYQGQDHLGIIFQLAVVPVKHRKLIGATLVKDFFDRSPYGMKLACCWCAQDLPANHFWEAMGFVPIAFRTGSRRRQRIHIFWQRRVREGDTTTPFWFPKVTGHGQIGEGRLILPIPPGYHWRDEFPVLLPDLPGAAGQRLLPNGLPDPRLEQKKPKAPPPAAPPADRIRKMKEQSSVIRKPPPGVIRLMTRTGPKHVATDDYVPPEKPVRVTRPRGKVDPKHAQAARELRDRFLEQLNSAGIEESGKYTPARALEDAPSMLGQLPDVDRVSPPGKALPKGTGESEGRNEGECQTPGQ